MGKALTVILVILLVIAVGAGGLFVGLYLMQGQIPLPSGGGNKLSFDENAGAYVEQTQESKPGVAIPGWGSLTIPADTEEVTVDFYNPESNKGYYYMTFELRLADTGETLYSSGLVQPGLHIQKITLSRGLPSGTYNAILHVQPYEMDEAQTPTNNADMNLKLIVK